MDILVLTTLAGLGGGLGAWGASLAGPQACTWPSLTDRLLVRRVAGLRADPPGRRRRTAGAMGLVLLLAGGGWAAYAAAPAAPDRLPSEVQGVVGSGDQLSLKLTAAAGGRTIKPGEAYQDGWMLKAVTASAATLAKDGQEKVVGLNPEGRLAAAAAAPVAPTTVTLAGGLPDRATIDAYLAKGYARYGADFISPAEAADPEKQRMVVYTLMTQEEIDRRRAAVVAAGGDGSGVGLTAADIRQLLGDAAYEDRVAIGKRGAAESAARLTADLAANPITGPSTYYMPAGVNMRDAQAAAGVDGRGVWQYGPVDAQGGRTVTRVGQTIAEMAGLASQSAVAQRAAAGLPPLP